MIPLKDFIERIVRRVYFLISDEETNIIVHKKLNTEKTIEYNLSGEVIDTGTLDVDLIFVKEDLPNTIDFSEDIVLVDEQDGTIRRIIGGRINTSTVKPEEAALFISFPILMIINRKEKAYRVKKEMPKLGKIPYFGIK